MVTNFHNKNFALSLAFIMRFKATRKWPIGQSGQVLLCWMKLLTRSHSGQAKQNKTKQNKTTATKTTHLITNQQMPGTAQNLTSTTPITPRNSCIYFKPNNPADCPLAAPPPSSFLVTYTKLWRPSLDVDAHRHTLKTQIDLSHTAAMLSLRGIKSFVFHRKPRIEFASGQSLPCQNKAFYSPKTQHGRRVIRIYCSHKHS